MYAFENIMFNHNKSVIKILFTSVSDFKCGYDTEAEIKLSNR